MTELSSTVTSFQSYFPIKKILDKILNSVTLIGIICGGFIHKSLSNQCLVISISHMESRFWIKLLNVGLKKSSMKPLWVLLYQSCDELMRCDFFR